MENSLPSTDPLALRWRIAEVLAYMRLKGPLKNIEAASKALWAAELAPPGFTVGQGIPTFDPDPDLGSLKPDAALEAVEIVAKARVSLLRMRGAYPAEPAVDLAGGKFVLSAPWESLVDGTAQVETKGFFSADATPPWEVWVGIISEEMHFKNRWWKDTPWYNPYLLSWVPPELVDAVNAAVQTNSNYSLAWAEEMNSPVLDALRVVGIDT